MSRMIRVGGSGALLLAGLASLMALGTLNPASGGVNPNTTGGFATYTGQQDRGRIELTTDPVGAMSIVYYASNAPGSPMTAYTSYDLRKPDKCRIDVDVDDPGGDGKNALGPDGTPILDASDIPVGPILLFSLREYIDLDSSTVDEPTGSGENLLLGTSGIGLVDNGLGSREQNNCNQSNGRIADGQAIQLQLGPLFPAGTQIDYASFDIEGKFGAHLEAVTNATGRKSWFGDLYLGSDNEADAGGIDNDRVQVGEAGELSDNFDKIILAPVSDDGRGQLAVEGGGDFDVSVRPEKRTILYLSEAVDYEYVLVCDTNNGVYGANTYNEPAGIEAGTVQGITEGLGSTGWPAALTGSAVEPEQARLFRYAGWQAVIDPTTGEQAKDENGDLAWQQKGCDAIGANLSAGTGGVFFDPSTNDLAYLRVELVWVIPASEVDLAAGDPFARSIDVNGDGNYDPARYCASFGNEPDGTASTSPYDPTAPGLAVHPEETPWCVLSDSRVMTTRGGVDVVVQTMVWDGQGDPKWL